MASLRQHLHFRAGVFANASAVVAAIRQRAPNGGAFAAVHDRTGDFQVLPNQTQCVTAHGPSAPESMVYFAVRSVMMSVDLIAKTLLSCQSFR